MYHILSIKSSVLYNTTMLPDFPKLKEDVHKYFLMKKFEEARLSDPLLANIKHRMQHEGDDGTYETVDGYEKNKNYQVFEASYQITVDEIINADFEVVLKKFYDMGLEASSKIAKHSFQQISEIIDETGNSIQANGPWTKELFLETIRKIAIDFNEETGQPIMPTMYIHPSQTEGVRKMMQEAANDSQHKVEFDKIIEQKRKDFYDREANRKLVD